MLDIFNRHIPHAFFKNFDIFDKKQYIGDLSIGLGPF